MPNAGRAEELPRMEGGFSAAMCNAKNGFAGKFV